MSVSRSTTCDAVTAGFGRSGIRIGTWETVLRVAADQHESSSGDPGSVCDSVCRLRLPVVVPDEIAASGSGREEFLDDLETVVVLDLQQILALRRHVVPVDERLPGREEDDEEHRSGLPGALRSQPLPEPCSFVYVGDRLDFRLRPQDEVLEGGVVLDLTGSCLGLGKPARQHDQCRNGESQRSLAVQSHRSLLIYGLQPMPYVLARTVCADESYPTRNLTCSPSRIEDYRRRRGGD